MLCNYSNLCIVIYFDLVHQYLLQIGAHGKEAIHSYFDTQSISMKNGFFNPFFDPFLQNPFFPVHMDYTVHMDK